MTLRVFAKWLKEVKDHRKEGTLRQEWRQWRNNIEQTDGQNTNEFTVNTVSCNASQTFSVYTLSVSVFTQHTYSKTNKNEQTLVYYTAQQFSKFLWSKNLAPARHNAAF